MSRDFQAIQKARYAKELEDYVKTVREFEEMRQSASADLEVLTNKLSYLSDYHQNYLGAMRRQLTPGQYDLVVDLVSRSKLNDVFTSIREQSGPGVEMAETYEARILRAVKRKVIQLTQSTSGCQVIAVILNSVDRADIAQLLPLMKKHFSDLAGVQDLRRLLGPLSRRQRRFVLTQIPGARLARRLYYKGLTCLKEFLSKSDISLVCDRINRSQLKLILDELPEELQSAVLAATKGKTTELLRCGDFFSGTGLLGFVLGAVAEETVCGKIVQSLQKQLASLVQSGRVFSQVKRYLSSADIIHLELGLLHRLGERNCYDRDFKKQVLESFMARLGKGSLVREKICRVLDAEFKRSAFLCVSAMVRYAAVLKSFVANQDFFADPVLQHILFVSAYLKLKEGMLQLSGTKAIPDYKLTGFFSLMDRLTIADLKQDEGQVNELLVQIQNSLEPAKYQLYRDSLPTGFKIGLAQSLQGLLGGHDSVDCKGLKQLSVLLTPRTAVAPDAEKSTPSKSLS